MPCEKEICQQESPWNYASVIGCWRLLTSFLQDRSWNPILFSWLSPWFRFPRERDGTWECLLLGHDSHEGLAEEALRRSINLGAYWTRRSPADSAFFARSGHGGTGRTKSILVSTRGGHSPRDIHLQRPVPEGSSATIGSRGSDPSGQIRTSGMHQNLRSELHSSSSSRRVTF